MLVPSSFLRRVALLLALPACLGRAVAGPTLACPDGPDPLRFRPDAEVASVSADREPLALAGAVDPATGTSSVALAFLTPGGEVAVALSTDGGCTFPARAILTAPGVVVTDPPAVAVRVAAPALLAVGWRDGDAVVVRTSLDGGASFAPAVGLDALPGRAMSAPRLAVTAGGAPLLMAAWTEDELGLAAPLASWTATGADAAAWSAPERIDGESAADLDVACDLAEAGDAPGCTALLTWIRGASAGVRACRKDAATPGWTRWHDFALPAQAETRVAAAADAGAGSAAWTAVALAPSSGEIHGDSALRSGGMVGDDFRGTSTIDPGGSELRRPAIAVAGGSAFFAFDELGEVQVARRPLDGSAPPWPGGCGPSRLSGLDPPRSAGIARGSVAAALGPDVIVAFVDDRDGSAKARFQRSDSEPPSVTLTNAAPNNCFAPARVLLEWSALPCDFAGGVAEIGIVAGSTDFTRPIAGGTSLLVEGLEPGTGYFLRLRLRDSAGHEQVTNEVAALTPDCSDAVLQASIVSVTDACSAGGAGGDGNGDPGETLRVTVRYENTGTAVASTPQAQLLSRSPFVTVRGGSRSLIDLDPGAFDEATFDVDVSATAPCGTTLPLIARGRSGTTSWDDLVSVGLPAACTPCRLPGCGIVADASRTAPREICRGEPVVLDGTATAGTDCAGILVYEWWSGSTLVGPSNALTQTPTTTTTYRLRVRCSTDLDCAAEDTVEVVVHPLPAVSIAFDPPPPHCAGAAVTLIASAGDPAATFAWSDGSTGDRIVTSTPGVFGVTATDSHGCRRSTSERVELGEIPPADAGPDASGCGSVLLGTPGYPLLDYRWEPAALLADPTAAQARATISGTYTLTVTDPLNGCSATDDVVASVIAGPPAPLDLRVRKGAAGLVATWSPASGSPGARLYSDTVAEAAAGASARSLRAVLRCEGVSACTTALTPEPLLFLQVVALCADGRSEGPN